MLYSADVSAGCIAVMRFTQARCNCFLSRTDIIERTQIYQSVLSFFACMRASAGLIICKKQGYEGRNLVWSSKVLCAKSLNKKALDLLL